MSKGKEGGSPSPISYQTPFRFPPTEWSNALGVILKLKVAQLCPGLCNPMDYTVHGILQARILEWVAYPFSRRSSRPRNQTRVSCIAGGFFTS